MALHEQKTATFFRKQKLFFCTSLSLLSSKISFSINKKLSVYTSHSILPSKAILFHHKHRKFPPSHNLLSAKNTAVLSMSALNPCAVTPERRTDSKPFRRRFARKTGFDSCRRKLLLNYFRQSFESSPESRGSQTSGVLLVLFVQAKRIKPFPFGSSRFCKPRISSPQLRLRTNKIKSS